ncbi:hypothetical protein TrVFT333_009046 [Trichoderma virens FT-333]|nr:hypothetical protein TrVFT333_009046 [Trichoderma virens FT-333]
MWFLPCGLNGSTILVGRGTARALSFAGRRPPHSRDLERLPAAGQGALTELKLLRKLRVETATSHMPLYKKLSTVAVEAQMEAIVVDVWLCRVSW